MTGSVLGDAPVQRNRLQVVLTAMFLASAAGAGAWIVMQGGSSSRHWITVASAAVIAVAAAVYLWWLREPGSPRLAEILTGLLALTVGGIVIADFGNIAGSIMRWLALGAGIMLVGLGLIQILRPGSAEASGSSGDAEPLLVRRFLLVAAFIFPVGLLGAIMEISGSACFLYPAAGWYMASRGVWHDRGGRPTPSPTPPHTRSR